MTVKLDGFVKSINSKGIDMYGINVLEGGEKTAEMCIRDSRRTIWASDKKMEPENEEVYLYSAQRHLYY